MPQGTAPRVSGSPSGLVHYGSVFVGGMLGGSLRYSLSTVFPEGDHELSWTILIVNVVGAFILALILAGWTRRGHVAHPWRPFLATGVLGSFTTWSTFMADDQALGASGHVGVATAYVLGATALGVLAAGAGWLVAHRFVPVADGVPG